MLVGSCFWLMLAEVIHEVIHDLGVAEFGLQENRYDSLVSRAIASAWVVGPHGLEPWTKGL